MPYLSIQKRHWCHLSLPLLMTTLVDSSENLDNGVRFKRPSIPTRYTWCALQFSSVQFSLSVVSNSLQPHESQHTRPPCPSPTPGVHSDSRPSSQWCHPAISSSVFPFSSCPQSLPASKSFPMSQLFAWGGQSIAVSALASFLPKKSQGWSPSEWTGWISLQSKGLSRVFSNTTCTWSCVRGQGFKDVNEGPFKTCYLFMAMILTSMRIPPWHFRKFLKPHYYYYGLSLGGFHFTPRLEVGGGIAK